MSDKEIKKTMAQVSAERRLSQEMQFAAVYVSNGNNGTRAYMTVFPRVKTQSAAVSASEWLRRISIQAEIKRLTDLAWEREVMTAQEVLARMTRIAKAELAEAYDDQGRLLPLNQMPQHVRTAIKGFTEVRGVRVPIFWDKDKQLMNMAKHHKLLVDQTELSGASGGPIIIKWDDSDDVKP